MLAPTFRMHVEPGSIQPFGSTSHLQRSGCCVPEAVALAGYNVATSKHASAQTSSLLENLLVHSPVILAASEPKFLRECGLLYLHTLIRICRARDN
jgi:hypothetical protein